MVSRQPFCVEDTKYKINDNAKCAKTGQNYVIQKIETKRKIRKGKAKFHAE